MPTKVINLFGGSGVGKSTLAAGLFAEMKLQGYHVELVREFVKGWAWDGIKVGPFDQIYILGKQAKTESRLYGKVDWIVTDSPLLLSAIYEGYYHGHNVTGPAAEAFLSSARAQGIVHYNFLLTREKVFDPRGRYETEDQARKVDVAVQKYLTDQQYAYATIGGPDRSRVESILNYVKLIEDVDSVEGIVVPAEDDACGF